MKKKPVYDYYHIDTGFFPAQVKLCFSDAVFQKILKDHNLHYVKESALDMGIGETHYFTDNKAGLIVVVFDMDECDDEDHSNLVATICHESVHTAQRVMDYIGEDNDNIGEETRAYLTEHICKQIYKGFEVEKHKRETSRGKAKQKGKGKGGTNVQVDQHSDGGAGSNSDSELVRLLRGIKDGDGTTEL